MNRFSDRGTLAAALALAVAGKLSEVITKNGHATLAVSGGTTPQLFFEHLSNTELDWRKVTITLVDERQVDDTSPRSNARLVKAALLRNRAAAARFVPLYRNTAESAKLTLDIVVLGMGTDGHTASFFPGGDMLAEALDPNNADGVIEINAPAAGEPRLTFTLAKLLESSSLFLHIEGVEKESVLAKAMAGSDAREMPIRAILQSQMPLNIFWCP